MVVINGHDAIAGSSFSLLMIKGTVDPITVETLNVIRRETPTINANIQLPSYRIVIMIVINIIQIKPNKKPELNSLRIILQKPPFSKLPSTNTRKESAT